MSNEHTPGPWKFELDPPDSKYGVVVIGDHGIVTHAADARLIAAAPALLEACEAAIYFAEGAIEAPDAAEQCRTRLPAVMTKLLNAISKATTPD